MIDRIVVRIRRSGPELPNLVKQMAFATALAMNRTLEEGQAEFRARLERQMTIRSPFVRRLVKIRRDDRARADRLQARLRIEGPEGQEHKGVVLARHEFPGPQRRSTGGFSVDPSYRVQGMFFLPTTQLRPGAQSVIPRADYPSSLRLTPRLHGGGETLAANIHRTSTGKLQIKGKRRSFVLFGAHGGSPLGIFRRVGPPNRDQFGRDRNIQLMWRFRQSITLRRRLDFIPTVTGVVESRYYANFRGFLSHALRTAR